MATTTIINKTLEILKELPDEKVTEIADFAEYLLHKQGADAITSGIERLTSRSPSFDFLNSEPDLYTAADLKEKYK